jgi:hypothetical protein
MCELEGFPWQQGLLMDFSRSFVCLCKIDPFISLVDLGKKMMVQIIQAGNRNWNLPAACVRKIVV